MFDGPRVGSSYDPMRKQGAILLGNGGDNSVGSQGTFYEGVMTAGRTFPSDATDQKVQANVVAAGYGVLPVSLAGASAGSAPAGLQTFSPGSSQATVATFTNTTNKAVAGVRLSLALPDGQWKASVAGSGESSKTFAGPVEPGMSVSAAFKVTSGRAAMNGDLVAHADWIGAGTGPGTGPGNGAGTGVAHSASIAEKVRNVSAIKINEFHVGSSSSAEAAESFIDLFNGGGTEVDLSGWTLTEHPAQEAISALAREHSSGAEVMDNLPTPGAPNRYAKSPH